MKTPVKRGKGKIQVNSDQKFCKIFEELVSGIKSSYPYQMKSGKSLQVLIKGMDVYIDPEKRFKVKRVAKLRNRKCFPKCYSKLN